MDDALLVRGFERVRDSFRDLQRLVNRNCTARDALRQVVAFDQLHHEGPSCPPAFFEAVDAGDTWMVEGGQDFSFALKARQPFRRRVQPTTGRILMATWRFSLVSVARYTSPMPPAPICAVISYTPRRVPGLRDNSSNYRGYGSPREQRRRRQRRLSVASS